MMQKLKLMGKKKTSTGSKSADTEAAMAHHNAVESQKGSTRVRPGKIYMLLLPLLLSTIFLCSLVPVAAVERGWVYYRHNNIAYQAPGTQYPGSQQLRMWTGWRWGHNTIQDIFHRQSPNTASSRIYNKEVNTAGSVVPALTTAWMLLSALCALGYLFMWCLSSVFHVGTKAAGKATDSKKTSKPHTPFLSSLFWPLLAFTLGSIAILLAIASYIILAVNNATWSRHNLGRRSYVGWPSWAFWLAMAAGFLWLLTSLLALTEALKAKKRRRDAMSTYHHNQMVENERPAAPLIQPQPQQQKTYVEPAKAVAPAGAGLNHARANGTNGYSNGYTDGVGIETVYTGKPTNAVLHENTAYTNTPATGASVVPDNRPGTIEMWGTVENGVAHRQDVSWNSVQPGHIPKPAGRERI